MTALLLAFSFALLVGILAPALHLYSLESEEAPEIVVISKTRAWNRVHGR